MYCSDGVFDSSSEIQIVDKRVDFYIKDQSSFFLYYLCKLLLTGCCIVKVYFSHRTKESSYISFVNVYNDSIVDVDGLHRTNNSRRGTSYTINDDI